MLKIANAGKGERGKGLLSGSPTEVVVKEHKYNHTTNMSNSYVSPYTMESLPYPRFIGLKHVKNFTLDKPLIAEQWYVPAGTKVKLVQSANFGLCVIPKDTQDERGFIIPRTIFRW